MGRYYSEVDEDGIWRPYAWVTFVNGDIYVDRKLLVDSGADITMFPFEVGIQLGLVISEGETPGESDGIGGSVPILEREISIDIEDHRLQIPVAWALAEDAPLLLGRVVVFDKFDIEFKQADKLVIFRWRGDN